MKEKKVMNIFSIFLLFVMLIFISGQEGCGAPQQSQGGINFVPISGVSMLVPGDVLEKNEAFVVGVHVENYNPRDIEGTVCVRDDQPSAFGGIVDSGDGDCQSFFTRASELGTVQSPQSQTTQTQPQPFGSSSQGNVIPGTADLYFPETGEYMYQGLPELNAPSPATLFIAMKYREESEITGTVTSPDENQPVMTQAVQPINVMVRKSIFRRGESYQINLEISLTKQQDVEIYSPGFSEKDKLYFFAELRPLGLQCTDVNNNPISGLLEFRNEKIIKCSALTPSRTQQSYPLVINLDYGVSLERQYSFGIKTK
jgi:hypothetical protein